MLFDLAVGWLAWTSNHFDGLDFRVNVLFDVDLVALFTVLHA